MEAAPGPHLQAVQQAVNQRHTAPAASRLYICAFTRPCGKRAVKPLLMHACLMGLRFVVKHGACASATSFLCNALRLRMPFYSALPLWQIMHFVCIAHPELAKPGLARVTQKSLNSNAVYAAPKKQAVCRKCFHRRACSASHSTALAPCSSGTSVSPAACLRSRLASASEAARPSGACARPPAAVPGPPLAPPGSPSAACGSPMSPVPFSGGLPGGGASSEPGSQWFCGGAGR